MAKQSKKDGPNKHDKREERSLQAAVAEQGALNGHTGEAGTAPMRRKDFEQSLEHLQAELVKLQLWVKDRGAKVCVLFEGRDTAGKGGVIKCITERTSPRVFRVVALPAPTEREKSQM
jgi:polyphosphate kinase 2 (PPK2 family)